jgi:hypothetical protein
MHCAARLPVCPRRELKFISAVWVDGRCYLAYCLKTMTASPVRTITFLFTDVQGRSSLQAAHPDAYRSALRRHHELLDNAVQMCNGVVFETVGDAVYASFERPTDALRAALAGHHETIGVMCQLRGASAYRQGKFVEARGFCQGYLEMCRELGSPWHLSNALAQFASLAAAQGQPERAARLIGAAAVMNETFRARPIPLIEELLMEGVGLARQALGDAAFAVVMAQGQAMTPEEAITEALAVEVEHILDKLGFASRAQIRMWAAAQEAHAATS